MKIKLMAALVGFVAVKILANPITNQGAVMTWETLRVDGVAGTTNIDISAVGTLDWVLFSTNAWPQAEQRKSGGAVLGGFSSDVAAARIDDPGVYSMMFNWTDGSPTNTSAGTDMGSTVKTFVNGYTDPNNEVLNFSVTLPGGQDTYVLRTYHTDQRLGTRLEVSNTVSGVWDNFPEEALNDAADLRVHKITITDVASPTTFDFKLVGRKTGSTHSLRALGGIAVEVIAATGDPELLLNPSDQLNTVLTAPSTLSTGTVEVAFEYGFASNNVEVTSVAFSNLSHGAGSFNAIDSFPVNLTQPSPSNETLSIQFDNSVAGLSDGESASGVALVNWTEIGSAVTNAALLPVLATYDDAPAELVLNPADQLYLTVIDPSVVTTGSVEVSYNEATAFPTGVVITAVNFSNATHTVFSNLTPLNLELNDPAPSNSQLQIEFDASALSNGDVATGLVVVTWNEMGDATVREMVLPIVGAYHELAPVTGTITKKGSSFPTNNVVLESRSSQNGSGFVRREGIGGTGGYAKLTQEIKASALSAVNYTFDSMQMRMRFGNDLRTASGANQLQMWFGTINETTGGTNSTVSTEVFDCSIVDFNKNQYYEFTFGSPVSFDPAALASNESYAIQLWFTTDDPRNELIFWHSETTNTVDGGFYVELDPSNTDKAFPIGMTSSRLENQDLHFALLNSAGGVGIGDITVVVDGSDLIMGWEGVDGASYAVQRKEDLVDDPWSNVVTGIAGVGLITVTNDTTDPQAFYRTVLE